MDFAEKLKRYAELLIVHGLNVQPGQIVQISTEACHREFALLVGAIAYEKGAKYVGIDLAEPRIGRLRIMNSNKEDLEFVPDYLELKYRQLVDTTAANLRIIGSENPDILADLDPKRVNTVRLHQRMAARTG